MSSSRLLAASLGIIVTQTYGIAIKSESTSQWEAYHGPSRHGGGYAHFNSMFNDGWLDNYHGSSWGKKDSKFAEHVLSDIMHHEHDAMVDTIKWGQEAHKYHKKNQSR